MSAHLTADDVERIKSNPAARALLSSALKSRRFDLYGPFLIGAWLDSLFLGLVIVLWLHWFVHVRQSDSKWTRRLVYYIMLPNLFSTTCLVIHVLRLMAVNFGDYLGFFDLTLPRMMPLTFVVSRFPVAAFFGLRAYRLNKEPKWFSWLLAPLLAGGLVGGAMGTVYATSLPMPQMATDSGTLYAACMVASDLLITVMMFRGLLRSKSGWEHTDRVVNRLMRLILETQLPPTAIAVAFLVIMVTKPDGTALGYCLFFPKVHVVCLMAVVNARLGLRGDSTTKGSSNFKSSHSHSKGSVRVGTVDQHQQQPSLDYAVPRLGPVFDAKEEHSSNSSTGLVRGPFV